MRCRLKFRLPVRRRPQARWDASGAASPKGGGSALHASPRRAFDAARPVNKVEAISTARAIFPRCQFDEVGCSVGLKRLRAYRKEWDAERGVWKAGPGTTMPRTGRMRS
jgi:hypothetical protein